MSTWKKHAILAAVIALVAACTTGDEPGVTTTTGPDGTTTDNTPAGSTTTLPAGEVGTEENPISILVVSDAGDETGAGGDALADALETRTGYVFEVVAVDSYGAAVEQMCAEPAGSMALIPAHAYVVGSDLCGVRVALKAVLDGYSDYWAQFLVPRGSNIETLEDLEGKTWAHPGQASASGWLVPMGMLTAAGIEPGTSSDLGNHRNVVQAVYQGDAKFGTTFYLPPIDAAGNDLWDGTVENADVPDELLPSCEGTPGNRLFCGDNFEVRDARRTIAAENPDVAQKVRILTVSDPIPNDTVSFSPDFPGEIEEAVVDTLLDIARNRPNAFAKAFAAWSWTGVVETNDAEFETVRELATALGLTPDDLG